jgi:hypothetical protein
MFSALPSTANPAGVAIMPLLTFVAAVAVVPRCAARGLLPRTLRHGASQAGMAAAQFAVRDARDQVQRRQ